MKHIIAKIVLAVVFNMLVVALVAAAAIPPAKIINNILVDTRGGVNRLITGVGISGLEYDLPHPKELHYPASYPGVEGTNYFIPTLSMFQSARSLKARAVRLPFDLGRLAPGSRNVGYTPGKTVVFNSVYLGYIDKCIAMAQSTNLLLILEMHNYLYYLDDHTKSVILINDSPTYQAFLAQAWKQLAQRYSNKKIILGYELMNEPNEYSGESNWLSIAQNLINVVRSVDAERFLFIDGKTFSSAGGWLNGKNVDLETLTDTSNKIVYVPHLYVDKNYDGKYDLPNDSPGADWKNSLYMAVWKAIAWSKQNNKPILFDEVGFLTIDDSWGKVYEELMKEYLTFHNVGMVLWSLEPENVQPHQDTYILGKGRLIADIFTKYANIRSNPSNHNEDFIFRNNLHNGFMTYGWNGLAVGIDENTGLNGSQSLKVDFKGDWGSDGFNIASKDGEDKHTSFDTKTYTHLSFYYKGPVKIRVFGCNESATDCGITVELPACNKLAIHSIKLSDIAPRSDSFDLIKIQTDDNTISGSLYFDNITLSNRAPIK